jgi:hypothetical protein
MSITAEQIKEKVKALKDSEINNGASYSFFLPTGTEFKDSWAANATKTADNTLILDQNLKVNLRAFHYEGYGDTRTFDGLRLYGFTQCHRKDGQPNYNNCSYRNCRIVMNWAEMAEQPIVAAAIEAWLEKITPAFTVTKEKGTIKFINDKTGEGLTCNLGKQEFSRTYKKGKERVIRYPTQFFKYVSGRLLAKQIADGDCQNFKTLVTLVTKEYRGCRNFGTFLVRMFDHTHLEPYIAAGVEFDFHIPFLYQNFGKDMRAKLNAEKIKYDNNVGSLFCSDLDIGRAVFTRIKDKAGFKNMVRVLAQNIQPMNTLVNHYHYDLGRLFDYCSKKNWQACPKYDYYTRKDLPLKPNPEDMVENIDSIYHYDIVTYLRDYARMAIDVYGDNYEKYPADLKAAHDDVTTIYRTRQQHIDAKKFADMIDKNLEWKSKDYLVIYPETPELITQEGQKLRHCVGGYIQSVVRGECKIVFLRHKDEPEKPLITVEIVGNNIRQARGYGNCAPKYDEKQALKDYAKEKKLLYN